MQRFRFHLQPVLNWRDLRSGQERDKLDRLIAEEHNLSTMRKDLQCLLAATAERTGVDTVLDAAELQALSADRAYLRNEDRRLEASQQESRKRVERQREQCIDADRQKQLISKLKERRHAEWSRETGRLLDELASESFLSRWRP
jgi:hypothetical protein